MVCSKCGFKNESGKELCVVCGAKLNYNESQAAYNASDLMKLMNDKPADNSQVASINNLTERFGGFRKRIKKRIALLLPILFLLIVVVIAIYLLFGDPYDGTFESSEYSDASYNSKEERAWKVMDGVLFEYMGETDNINDVVDNKYIVCFGTTYDDDCNVTDGQIILDQRLGILASNIVSGKVIINLDDSNQVFCENLTFDDGYLCNSNDGETMICDFDEQVVDN